VVNRPSVPEIITVNSESLQTQIRDLLPSQNGFGSELQATNVITPIIDLTAAAEGSGLASNLQTAIAFGSQTAFESRNATSTLASSPGFYLVQGVSSVIAAASGATILENRFDMTDGVSTKTVWSHQIQSNSTEPHSSIEINLIFWLAAGITLTCVSNGVRAIAAGSTRQIADSQGALVQPNGYPL
tara:strand:+ start:493 stop:1050 length:558 start_codon:yes stop_codon:yes gene_type:complete